METARKLINKDYNLIFIHFKSSDIADREYEPFDTKT